jgi:type 1 glutamine amidotransferase
MRVQRWILPIALVLAVSAGAADPPVKVLIVTGDNVPAHDWKGTTEVLREFLTKPGKIDVDVTSAPSKALTDENLAKYDVLLLNYRETGQGSAESKWSDANKAAFLKAVKDGKGLVVSHFSSAAFANPNWAEFEKAVAGGWRSQGYHGPPHEFKVKKTDVKHPISDGLPTDFNHVTDELYSASMRTRNSVVLATAYCDPSKPQGTGMDEAVIWVNQYGKGRVVENVLGHDVKALSDPNYQTWMRRCVEWAARGSVSKD